MEKLIFLICILAISMVDSIYAQPPAAAIIQAPITWLSKNSSDEITINNGNSNKLTITINVDKNINVPDSVGINVKNCGNTTHIAGGSSGVCTTNDPANPVSFSSDSPSIEASGTYAIKQE